MKFTAEFLREVDMLHEEKVGTSRWAIEYEGVFEHEGKLYGTGYRRGTGDEGERPWEYLKATDEVECPEMEKYEKTVVSYRVKK